MPAESQNDQKSADMKNWKPGSEPEKASAAGAARDFGVPETGRTTTDRDYVSRNTKMSDPGAAQPRSGDADGGRVSGAGAPNSGPGSSSGGDIDTDIIGVGTGGSGLAATPADEPPGPDDTDSNGGFSPPDDRDPRTGKMKRIPDVAEGTVMQTPVPGDDPLVGEGADGTNTARRGDDSFASEISRGEASGDDND